MSIRFFGFLAALCFFATAAMAESAADIQRRMSQRLPTLDALKEKQAIGENNRGLVEVRDNAPADAAKVVADENRDRGQVYALIAQQTGANADAVGRARAKMIAENSHPGVWLQDESGHWHRK
jgi:uncharacterized protein YdbL (DUF1318 family)